MARSTYIYVLQQRSIGGIGDVLLGAFTVKGDAIEAVQKLVNDEVFVSRELRLTRIYDGVVGPFPNAHVYDLEKELGLEEDYLTRNKLWHGPGSAIGLGPDPS